MKNNSNNLNENDEHKLLDLSSIGSSNISTSPIT